jgi:hypothetical protein
MIQYRIKTYQFQHQVACPFCLLDIFHLQAEYKDDNPHTNERTLFTNTGFLSADLNKIRNGAL